MLSCAIMGKFQCISLLVLVTFAELSSGYICEGLHCEADKCSEGNVCSIGCVDGFSISEYGHCLPDCPVHCIGCEDFQCVSCLPGYYGDDCMLFCDGCRYGQCDLTNGQCLEGCKEGFEVDLWCNVTTNAVKKQTTLSPFETDENARKVYIWIASLLISAVILVVIAIIVYISIQRKRGWKSYDVKFENTEYQPTQNVEERIEMDEV